MSESSPFERLGGEWVLRGIIHDFVDSMVNDTMIGFFFRNVDPKRLEEMEYQFTAKFLGADIVYTGKAIREAHRPHPIMGGQFERRRKILLDTMRRHGVPADIEAAWMNHVDQLRPQVTRDTEGECIDPLTAKDDADV